MSINPAGLLEPQVSHVQRLVDSIYKNGFALDLSETGTGKTFSACAVAREMSRPFIVICPKTVIPQWERIIATFGLRATAIVNYERLVRGTSRWMRWKVMQDPQEPWNARARREIPVFNFPSNALIIVDEVHRCKGMDTSNSWLLVALRLQSFRTLLASATAATSPLEMKALGYMCGLHALHNFTAFCRTHGCEWEGRFGAMVWNSDNPSAIAAMLNLNEYLFQIRECASRLTVTDFGKLFPESHIVAEAYDLGENTGKIQRIYDEMESELAALDERAADYSQHVFAIMMEARRRAELCKVPIFVEMIEELYDEGKSVAIFLNFDDTVQAVLQRLQLLKKFKNKIAFIVGGQSPKDRQADIDAFNADTKRIMIANIAAGGVGVSLHDLNGKYARASIISPTWSAFNMRQALGRVWRLNGLTKSYQRIVYAAGCIEEQICHKVQFRLNCLNTLNDGDLAEVTNFMETA